MTEQLPYQVTAISEAYGIDATGKLVKQKVVYYRTAAGDSGSVSVPVSDYTADYVTSLIEHEVEQHAKLHGLT